MTPATPDPASTASSAEVAEAAPARPRVGVIGLGVMGSAMAGHLSAAGFTVCGYDIDPAKVTAAAARDTSSVAEVAQRSDIVLLSLPSTESLEAVTAELAAAVQSERAAGAKPEPTAADSSDRAATAPPDPPAATPTQPAAGAPPEPAAGARPGLLAVEMGTLPLEAKQRAAEHLAAAGCELLDAPVSGTGLQAADATLVIYSSGSRAGFERVSPIFDVIGRRAYHLGTFGNGTRMKFVANLLVAVHTLAAAEAHALGAAAGLDPAIVQEVISAGVGTSSIFDIRGPMMVADNFDPPSARLAIIDKDARIIAEFARSLGTATPLLDAALPLYRRGVTGGLGDLDAAALRRLFDPARPSDTEAAGRLSDAANTSRSINTDDTESTEGDPS